MRLFWLCCRSIIPSGISANFPVMPGSECGGDVWPRSARGMQARAKLLRGVQTGFVLHPAGQRSGCNLQFPAKNSQTFFSNMTKYGDFLFSTYLSDDAQWVVYLQPSSLVILWPCSQLVSTRSNKPLRENLEILTHLFFFFFSATLHWLHIMYYPKVDLLAPLFPLFAHTHDFSLKTVTKKKTRRRKKFPPPSFLPFFFFFVWKALHTV